MGFAAVRLSNGEYDQKGFETAADAEKYIEGLVCEVCVEDMKRGFITFSDGDGGESITDPVTTIMDTPCGAEWLVITDEDYDSVENVSDLFIAAGMTPSDDKTMDRLTAEQLEKIRRKQEEREQEEKDQE